MVAIIAKSLKDRRQYAALSAIFSEADISGDGKISVAECLGILDEYGVQIPDDEIEHISKLEDAHGNVTRESFIQYVKDSKTFKTFEEPDEESAAHFKKKLELAFDMLDMNNDGFVSKKEFREMTSSRRIKEKHIKLMFQRCDLDGDGKLDKDEFKRLIYNNLKKKADDKHKMDLLSPDQWTDICSDVAGDNGDSDGGVDGEGNMLFQHRKEGSVNIVKQKIESLLFKKTNDKKEDGFGRLGRQVLYRTGDDEHEEEVEEEIYVESDEHDADDEADIEEEVMEEVSSDLAEDCNEELDVVSLDKEDSLEEILEELVIEEQTDEEREIALEESIAEELEHFL